MDPINFCYLKSFVAENAQESIFASRVLAQDTTEKKTAEHLQVLKGVVLRRWEEQNEADWKRLMREKHGTDFMWCNLASK